MSAIKARCYRAARGTPGTRARARARSRARAARPRRARRARRAHREATTTSGAAAPARARRPRPRAAPRRRRPPRRSTSLSSPVAATAHGEPPRARAASGRARAGRPRRPRRRRARARRRRRARAQQPRELRERARVARQPVDADHERARRAGGRGLGLPRRTSRYATSAPSARRVVLLAEHVGRHATAQHVGALTAATRDVSATAAAAASSAPVWLGIILPWRRRLPRAAASSMNLEREEPSGLNGLGRPLVDLHAYQLPAHAWRKTDYQCVAARGRARARAFAARIDLHAAPLARPPPHLAPTGKMQPAEVCTRCPPWRSAPCPSTS